MSLLDTPNALMAWGVLQGASPEALPSRVVGRTARLRLSVDPDDVEDVEPSALGDAWSSVVAEHDPGPLNVGMRAIIEVPNHDGSRCDLPCRARGRWRRDRLRRDPDPRRRRRLPLAHPHRERRERDRAERHRQLRPPAAHRPPRHPGKLEPRGHALPRPRRPATGAQDRRRPGGPFRRRPVRGDFRAHGRRRRGSGPRHPRPHPTSRSSYAFCSTRHRTTFRST